MNVSALPKVREIIYNANNLKTKGRRIPFDMTQAMHNLNATRKGLRYSVKFHRILNRKHVKMHRGFGISSDYSSLKHINHNDYYD